MAIRVVHWGTGNTGREALRGVIEHPDLELVGLLVTAESKEGRDAGELAGLRTTTGVRATRDVEHLLAAKPGCLLYAGNGAGREADAARDMARFLERGIDVATISLISMVYPPSAPADVRGPLEAACAKGGSSFFDSGSSPGFITAGLATALLSTAGRVDGVHLQEFVNCSRYAVPHAMRISAGMGQPPDYVPQRVGTGIIQKWWGALAHHVAEVLGDPIVSMDLRWETATTTRDIATDFGDVPTGTIGCLHWILDCRTRSGRPISVEHFMRAAADVAPEWTQPPPGTTHSACAVVVDGRPPLRLGFPIDYLEDERLDSSLILTAMHVVNAIPALVASSPGVKGPDDLPLPSRRTAP
ncbi:MAG TPA: hypothetical protein VJM11_06025 [Nevskiaceae bacterium]|nr:hypothetical protein [Nevskiaceae bacterium]